MSPGPSSVPPIPPHPRRHPGRSEAEIRDPCSGVFREPRAATGTAEWIPGQAGDDGEGGVRRCVVGALLGCLFVKPSSSLPPIPPHARRHPGRSEAEIRDPCSGVFREPRAATGTAEWVPGRAGDDAEGGVRHCMLVWRSAGASYSQALVAAPRLPGSPTAARRPQTKTGPEVSPRPRPHRYGEDQPAAAEGLPVARAVALSIMIFCMRRRCSSRSAMTPSMITAPITV